MTEMALSESKEKSILDELAHSETVRKLIECPVCLELPLPPIYVCNKGHIVCNACQARTYACPLCREHYSSTRGFVAEGLIEKCILKCKYADHGCSLTMRGSALVDHLELCDYRPVKCIDCGGKLVNFDEYEEHLLKFHRINGIYQSRAYVIYSMNLTHQIAFGEKCCWPQYYLKAFDNVTFLLRLYATHWFVCAWISLLGPKSDCSKYEALLEFHPTNDDSVVHTWQGPVNHFRDDPAKQIFLQGRGLITPMETLMQIAPVANDHAEWLYNIEILHATPKPLEDPNETTSPEEAEASQVPITNGDSTTEEKSSCETAESTRMEEGDRIVGPTALHLIPTSESTQKHVPRIGHARMMSDTPRLVGTPYSMRTPRRPGTGASAITQSSGAGATNVLTARPATLSHSSSVLAAAATVASVIPTPMSMMENVQNLSASSSTQSMYNDANDPSSPSPVTVSTLRSTSRFLNNMRARASATTSSLPFMYRGAASSLTGRGYSFPEDEWNFTSASEDDDEE